MPERLWDVQQALLPALAVTVLIWTLHRERVPIKAVVERARDRDGLMPWIVGNAAGVQINAVYFWTPIAGYLLGDGGLVSEDRRPVAGYVNAAAFGCAAVGALILVPIARRCDQRRLMALLAVLGAVAMGLQGVVPELSVIVAAASTGAFLGVGIHIALPLLLARSARRGRTSGWFNAGWIATVSVLLLAETQITEHAGWTWAAYLQCGLGILSAPVMMLPRRDTRPRDRRSIFKLWWRTVATLGNRKMRWAAAIYAISGGQFGLYNATYSALLEDAGQEHWAWVPTLAFLLSMGVSFPWGWAADHHSRAGLVTAASITFVAFLVGGYQVGVVTALTWLVISIWGFLVEIGTTGNTVVAPAVLLDDGQSELENALLQFCKFGGMAVVAVLGSMVLDQERAVLWIAALGLLVGVVGVVASVKVPLVHAGGKRDGRAGADGGRTSLI